MRRHRQRAATAMQAGVIVRSEASATMSAADRTRIVMEARTREAEVSNAAAQRARDQALVSRLEAGQQQAAAEIARARAAKLQQELAACRPSKPSAAWCSRWAMCCLTLAAPSSSRARSAPSTAWPPSCARTPSGAWRLKATPIQWAATAST